MTQFNSRRKSIARCLLLPALMVLTASQVWGDSLLESELLAKKGCKFSNSENKHHSILDINIGYPTVDGPVPTCPECLFPQELPNTTTTIFHGAAVGPTIAVNPKNPKHIVASWQQDRINNTGALEGSIGYSRDGGSTWHRTTIPLQSCIGGINQRSSDVWLSYAPDGSRVYFSALVLNSTEDINTQNQQGLVVSISEDDGIHWSCPHFVSSSSSTLAEFLADDKNSITADRNSARNAYVVWDHAALAGSDHKTTHISRTTNGGKTWSPNQLLYDPYPDLTRNNQSNGILNDNQTINNIIVVQPKAKFSEDSELKETSPKPSLEGDLINFMVRLYAKPDATDEEYVNDSFPYQYTLSDIALVRSKDHGKTWEKNATIVTPINGNAVFTGGYTYVDGQITGGVGTQIRTGQYAASYNVNPKNGFLYVVWRSDQFRADQLPQIALSTSRDGGKTWSEAVQVSRTPVNSPNPQAFSPFVAITKKGYVGVLYSDFRNNDDKLNPNQTKTDTWLAIYKEVDDPQGGDTGAGLQFVKEVRLSKKSYIAQNGPVTTQGVMTTGDYPFLDVHGDKFYAVYTKSFEGPFAPPTLILDDPSNNAKVFLDSNYRQAPFFSLIKQE